MDANRFNALLHFEKILKGRTYFNVQEPLEIVIHSDLPPGSVRHLVVLMVANCT